jgi:hypothetical protein
MKRRRWRMERTRVAIVDLPPLPAEILGQRLTREAGFSLDRLAATSLSPTAASLDGIDVLITGWERTDAELVGELLEQHPRLTILCIRPDGRCSILACLVPEIVVLGDTSPQDLVARLAQPPAPWGEALSRHLHGDGCGDPIT